MVGGEIGKLANLKVGALQEEEWRSEEEAVEEKDYKTMAIS